MHNSIRAIFISFFALALFLFLANNVFAFGECSKYGVMASYDSFTHTCSCMSGYIFSDNGILGTTCISKNTYCSNKYGFDAMYDILSDSCTCRSGYIMGSGLLGNKTCVSANSECRKEYGIMAEYDSFSKKCKCSYGYVFDTDSIGGTQCVSEDSWCQNKYGYNSRYNSLSDQCECRSGYELTLKSLGGLECKSCFSKYGLHSSYDSFSKKCECDDGYTLDNNNQCIEKQNNVYFLLEKLDLENDKAIVKSDYDYREYLIEYGVGCISIENYVGKKLVINLGTDFDLDTWDKIVLQDNDQTCNITSKELSPWNSEICDKGYHLKNNRCLEIECPSNSTRYGNSCFCNSGYRMNASGDYCDKIIVENVNYNITNKNSEKPKLTTSTDKDPKLKIQAVSNGDKKDSISAPITENKSVSNNKPTSLWNKITNPIKGFFGKIFK